MDYKKLAADLLSGCEENCADCEYAGESEFECTIAQLAATAITDMLARAETAEARCKRLEEARENANEAAAKWEGMYHMAEARAEKAERERDAAIEEIPKICYYCKHRKGWKFCEDWNGNQEAETCEKWEWRGQKEE